MWRRRETGDLAPRDVALIEARVRAVPGVVRTSYANIAPWAGRNSTGLSQIDGTPIPQTRDYTRDPARRLVEGMEMTAVEHVEAAVGEADLEALSLPCSDLRARLGRAHHICRG